MVLAHEKIGSADNTAVTVDAESFSIIPAKGLTLATDGNEEDLTIAVTGFNYFRK